MKQAPTPYEILNQVFSTRVKTWSPDLVTFKVDDQDARDTIPIFCVIHAKADKSSGTFQLEVQNIPMNESVEELAEELEGTWSQGEWGKHLCVNLSLKDLTKINRLAKAIRSVVGRGANYPVPSWKWIAPRTAASLEQFVRKMKEALRC